MKDEIKKYILELCENRDKKLIKIINQINHSSTPLFEIAYYPMSDFNKFISNVFPTEKPYMLASRITTGNFQTAHEYFHLTSYGSIVSCYESELFYIYANYADEIAEAIINNIIFFKMKNKRIRVIVENFEETKYTT